MSKVMTVNTLGPQLAVLLGLPKNLISFELRCAVDEIVTVKCKYYPELSDIGAVLAEYELVPRTTGQPVLHQAEIMGFDAWMRDRVEQAHRLMMEHIRLGW